MTNPYAAGQLAKALTTAATHEDEATRRRAEARVRAWTAVLDGMRDGAIQVGSRTPVRGYPEWVTLQVMRGGFATGFAVALGAVGEDELARADRLGLPPLREAIFASYLTDAGMAELLSLVESGAYEVRIPEDAALLVVATLARDGHRSEALELLDVLRPFADNLRFMPRAGRAPTKPPEHVQRRTSGEVLVSLQSMVPQARVEAQREALAVWLPLTDRFVQWWRARLATGDVESWTSMDRHAARSLVAAYDFACRDHTRCRKYRNPKQNLPILVAATWAVAEGTADAGVLSRVRHVLGCLEAKSRLAGDRAGAVRAEQARVVAQPSRTQLAHVAADRLNVMRDDEGYPDATLLLGPVEAAEAVTHHVPAGTSMPPSVERRVLLGVSGAIEDLHARGLIPSAEVLAELVPALSAQQVRRAVSDPELGRLLAATYEAFRRRRSVLLLNLEKQVQFTELPWVRAALAVGGAPSRPDDPISTAHRVAALALDWFPGTILPNALIAELTTLYAAAGERLPLTEELAADIFMGRFSPKFLASARVAGEMLQGSLYERYYGIDYAEVLALPEPPPPSAERRRFWQRAAKPAAEDSTFDALCQRGIPAAEAWSSARNGMVIERQQVLTTHNLAVLTGPGGAVPSRNWADLAVAAAARTASLLALAQTQWRPKPTIKDAAYAWRQAVFCTTMADSAERAAILEQMAAQPSADQWPMTDVLAGFAPSLGAPSSRDSLALQGHRPFLGWTIERHWAVPAPADTSRGRAPSAPASTS